MPRFYFDVRDGESFIGDGEGLLFPDIESARDEATRALAEIALDVLPGAIVREIAIEVRDQAGEQLLRTALRFEIERFR